MILSIQAVERFSNSFATIRKIALQRGKQWHGIATRYDKHALEISLLPYVGR
jgi:hypothetical protein